uniref:Uncharacterized protein n=1 Tax=Anguilla anguilla TaxID=7936 RepID=A0A0E9U412_ANGAN
MHTTDAGLLRRQLPPLRLPVSAF